MLAAAGVVLVVLAILAVGAVLGARAGDGRVAPNVVLSGRRVGSMGRDELSRTIHTIAGRYTAATVEIRAPGGGLQATGTELGMVVKEAETAMGVLQAGKAGGRIARAWHDAWSYAHPRAARVRLALDPVVAYDLLTSRDQGPHSPATEPTLADRDDQLVVVDGRPGRGISPTAVAGALEWVPLGHGRLVVRVPRGDLEPRFRRADVERLLPAAKALTRTPLTLAAGDTTADVTPTVLRTWVQTLPGEDTMGLGVEESRVTAALAQLLSGAGDDPVDARFSVSGSSVTLTPSRAGSACCAPEAPARIAAALADRPPTGTPVRLPLRSIEPKRTTESARKLGITQPVASFTTHHNPGEPRVRNIHRIADLVRGSIIGPGESLSINGLVGPRTAEKGFVEAPVIDEHNTFSTGVGGGVSQFSTTMFNAAFFAGLEIPEYSAHGLYIPRYPFGREATLSFPHPDLIVRNPSPFGVLVWPSYTETDVTVTLYSTKWVEADQTDQTVTEKPARPGPDRDPAKSPLGPCKSTKTQRTRRYLSDGRTTVDFFYALYRPEEGAECPK